MLAINAYAELKDGLNPTTKFKCCAETIPSKTSMPKKGKILACRMAKILLHDKRAAISWHFGQHLGQVEQDLGQVGY